MSDRQGSSVTQLKKKKKGGGAMGSRVLSGGTGGASFRLRLM